jgi:outer membrane murein-binding lipoprotein Lpp
MELISDILLVAGSTGAAFYCIVLSRKLNKLNDLESGVGGAIATLSSQVNEMTKTISLAQNSATESTIRLDNLNERAENVARRLELLVASMHDLPTVKPEPTNFKNYAIARINDNAPPPKKTEAGGSLFRSARKENSEVTV